MSSTRGSRKKIPARSEIHTAISYIAQKTTPGTSRKHRTGGNYPFLYERATRTARLSSRIAASRDNILS